jgi:hypothetical protein
VFENVFEYINDHGIRKYSYREYHRWWIDRMKVQFQATVADDVVTFDRRDGAGEAWVRISLPDSREGIFPFQERIDLSSAPLTKRPYSAVRYDYLEKIRSFDARHIAQNLFDWWIKITE